MCDWQFGVHSLKSQLYTTIAFVHALPTAEQSYMENTYTKVIFII